MSNIWGTGQPLDYDSLQWAVTKVSLVTKAWWDFQRQLDQIDAWRRLPEKPVPPEMPQCQDVETGVSTASTRRVCLPIPSGDAILKANYVIPAFTSIRPETANFSHIALQGVAPKGSKLESIINDVVRARKTLGKQETSWEFSRIPLDSGPNEILLRVDMGHESYYHVASRAYRRTNQNHPSFVLSNPNSKTLVGTRDRGFANTVNIFVSGVVEPGSRVFVEDPMNGGWLPITAQFDGSFYESEELDLRGEGVHDVHVKIVDSAGRETVIEEKIVRGYKFQNFLLKPGDLLFTNNPASFVLGNSIKNRKGDLVAGTPDHVGVYLGRGMVGEAANSEFGLRKYYLDSIGPENWFLSEDFAGARHAPFDVDWSNRKIDWRARENVADGIDEMILRGLPYQVPLIPVLQYNEEEDGFYCTELAYWAWHRLGGEEFSNVFWEVNVGHPAATVNVILPFKMFMSAWPAKKAE